jgi:hypothetical protein
MSDYLSADGRVRVLSITQRAPLAASSESPRRTLHDLECLGRARWPVDRARVPDAQLAQAPTRRGRLRRVGSPSAPRSRVKNYPLFARAAPWEE